MSILRHEAEAIARKYLGTNHLMKELGSGAEGYVFPSPHATAVKIFSYREKFERELSAYQRLRQKEVIEVLGFAVPRLVASSDELMVIEMTIVQPPFILDFAQAVLDRPADFPEGLDEWWERVKDAFGANFEMAQCVYYELIRRCDLYYYDLAPRNMNFANKSEA